MATKFVLVDDIDGGDAHNTHEVSYDGVKVKLDLSDENHDKLLKLLQPYLNAGEKVRVNKRIRPAKSGDRSEQLNAIREWARKQGHTVPDRGRIRRDIVAEFEKAHDTVDKPAFSAAG